MRILAIATLILLLAGTAAAVLDPAADGIGIYFDLEADKVEMDTEIASQIVHAYLIATNISAESGIARWEASLHVEGSGLLVSSWSYKGSDGDADADDYLVTLDAGEALAWSQAIVLAEWEGLVLGPYDMVAMYVGAREGDSAIQDAPSYASALSLSDVHELHVSSGLAGGGLVALINGQGAQVVVGEPRTMSAVKHLYR